jgi:hypothetical protein
MGRLVSVIVLLLTLTVPDLTRAQSGPSRPYLPPRPAPPDAGAQAPAPVPAEQPRPDNPILWGALAYTADGMHASSTRLASKGEADTAILKRCADFSRGKCEIVSIRGDQCVGLASYVATRGRVRYRLSYTAGGKTPAEAQDAALTLCKRDERTLARCTPRTALCADGRT